MNIRHLLDFRNFKLIKGDILDFDLMEKLTRDVDVIFHLAAQVHVDRSYIEPKLTYDVNVMGTQNILEAAKLNDVRKILYASTSEVYGSALTVPIDENHPLNAPHPYGASKIAADRMCHAYIETFGMDISILRPFNVFGPRQRDLGYGGVISIFARRLMRGMPPIIFGDGQQTRDYTYIDDVVNAYDLVFKHTDPLPGPVNFGSGTEETVIDIARTLIKIFNTDIKNPVHINPRIGEVQRLIADPRKAEKILGWKPNVKFEEGIKQFVEWYKNYGLEDKVEI